jgi:biotin transport system substrate-specific component
MRNSSHALSIPKENATFQNIATIVLGSLFVALCAQIEIRIGLSPVPFTLQTLAVLLVGATLGAKRGLLSLVLYALEGAAGLPVFAGASFGLAKLLGPTGGYLVGFAVSALTIGWLVEKGYCQTMRHVVLAFTFANIIIFTCGILWLTVLFGFDKALTFGLYPFIVTEGLKILFAAQFFPIVRRASSLLK